MAQYYLERKHWSNRDEAKRKREANPHLTSGEPSFVQQQERVAMLTGRAGCLILKKIAI